MSYELKKQILEEQSQLSQLSTKALPSQDTNTINPIEEEKENEQDQESSGPADVPRAQNTIQRLAQKRALKSPMRRLAIGARAKPQ